VECQGMFASVTELAGKDDLRVVAIAGSIGLSVNKGKRFRMGKIVGLAEG